MKELTSRQFVIIAIFVILTSKFVTMPSIIFASASTDSIFSILLGLLVELLLIFLITIVIKRNQDTNLFNLLKQKFTIVGALFIMLILFSYATVRLMYCYQELFSFFTELLYDEFPPLFFAIPTFFVTGYIAYKGARSLGRTFEILLPFIIVGTIIALISNIDFLSFDTNLPYFEQGLTPMLDGFLRSGFYFGNSLVLLFFVGKVKIVEPQKFVKNTMIALNITAGIILIACFLFYDVFGMSMQYTIFALTEYSQYDPFILELQRLVWLSAIVDITKLFCSTAVFVYCLGQAGKQVFNSKTTLSPIMISFLIIYSIATILHYDLEEMFMLVRNYFSFITIGIIALSLIICIILSIKRRKNEQKFIQ